MTDQAKGLLITFFGVLFVVPDSLFARLIDAEALNIAFWRLFLVGTGTGLWVYSRRGLAPFRAVLATGHVGAIYMLGVGASGVFFVLAVSLTSVANVVIIIAALPLFAALFSRVFLHEPFRPRTLLTIAAVAPGLAIVAYGSGETEGASLAGDLLAFGVSALYAAAITAARQARAISMVPAMAMGSLLVAVCLIPFAQPWEMPVDQAPLVAGHAAFILVSSVLLAIGPRFITSPEVGLLVLLESVLAPLLAWAVIGENPGSYALVGGAIVITALGLSNLVALMRRRRYRP